MGKRPVRKRARIHIMLNWKVLKDMERKSIKKS
jgi:hypothetical protein